jgi:hypothetical protein
MWEYFTSWTEGYGDYTEYIVTSAGEVYDASTGAVVGWYDEATDTVYDAAGAVITEVKAAGIEVYDDLKEGLSMLPELAEKAIEATDKGIDAADKALNIATVVLIGAVGLGAYLYFFGGKSAIMKKLR